MEHFQEQLSTIRKNHTAAEARVADEIAQLRASYERQIADLKQVIMLQDKIHRGALQQMESRLGSLQDAATTTKAAMQTRCSSADRPLHPSRRPSVYKRATESTPSHPASASTASGQGAVGKVGDQGDLTTDDDGAVRVPPAITEIITRHQSRINSIFDFYSASHVGDALFHPSMSMGAFTKMVQDCRLTSSSSGQRMATTADLLWIGVVRTLHANHRAKSRHTESNGVPRGSATPRRPSRSTLMVRGRYQPPTPEARDQLGFLRVEKIYRKSFGEVLYLLWRQSGLCQAMLDAAPGPLQDGGRAREAECFSEFLSRRVFPMTASAMEKRRRRDTSLLSSSYQSALQQSSRTGSPASASLRLSCSASADASLSEQPRDYSAVIQEQYGRSNAVKAVVREFASSVKRSYHARVRGAGNAGMDVDDFFSLTQKYNLLPLIRKTEVKQIFEHCCTDSAVQPRDGALRLSLHGYLEALYCLAEEIYSAPAVVHHYPDPESRLRKLFTKMFVLQT